MIAPLHPFEEAGLGVGPFRCTGVSQRRMPETGQPAGTCQFCGNGILNCYHILAADGRRFIVGSDCVKRTAGASAKDPVLIEVRRLERAAAAEKRDEKRQAKQEATHALRLAALDVLECNPTLFADQPHPNAYFAAQGRTRRDYFTYLLKPGGAYGSGLEFAIQQVHAAVVSRPAPAVSEVPS